MRVIALSVAFEIATKIALAQGAAGPMAQLPARPEQGGDNWVVSETTSPVDYKPIVIGTALSRGGSEGAPMQLSIHCRGGRTDLVISAPAISGADPDYAVAYRINDGQPVQARAGPPSFGEGVAFRGDVVQLLLSLPEGGAISIRLSTRTGITHEGNFSLRGLKQVRDKVAAACNWPRAVANPRN